MKYTAYHARTKILMKQESISSNAQFQMTIITKLVMYQFTKICTAVIFRTRCIQII